jgi:hypothetical protein
MFHVYIYFRFSALKSVLDDATPCRHKMLLRIVFTTHNFYVLFLYLYLEESRVYRTHSGIAVEINKKKIFFSAFGGESKFFGFGVKHEPETTSTRETCSRSLLVEKFSFIFGKCSLCPFI